MTVGHNITELSPERAKPDEMAGRLMESEHRGRYLWAAQLAGGRDVLDAGCGVGYGTEILASAGPRRAVGVDIAQEAIDQALASSASAHAEFRLGDLHELPFDDDAFDLTVCFEVLEHVNHQKHAIAELRRVLGPEGLLVISSPNRDVYPGGNPYHTHEFTPEELHTVLKEEFSHVRLYRQSPWLAAAVLDDEQSRSTGTESELALNVIKMASVEPGAEVFTIALASNVELPVPGSLALFGEPFEVRWWQDKLDNATHQRDEARSELEAMRVERDKASEGQDRANEERDVERKELGTALLAVEADLATANEHIAQLRSAEADLKRWSIAQLGERDELLLELEQKRGDIESRLRRAQQIVEGLTGSLSWRLTRPLRAVKRLFR